MNVPVQQRPHPPVYIAATNPAAAVEVGRSGHHLLTLVTPLTAGHAAVAELLAAYERGLEEAGHERAARDAVVVVFGLAAPTDHEARRLAGPTLARVLQAMAGGVVEPDAIFDHMRDNDLAAIGSPDHVEGFLARLEALGVRHVAFLHSFGGLEDEPALRSIRLLSAPQV